MAVNPIAHPPVVTPEAWREARLALLEKEKAFTRERDALSAARRALPMVRVEKDYTFEGHDGALSLLDLFEGRQQLIVYHFMFDPEEPPAGQTGAPWDEGCPGCSHLADNLPHLAHLHARETTLVLVSRAPLSKIAPFQARMGWTVPWYSSNWSGFNYDFHVSIDEAEGSMEWNYRNVVHPPEGVKFAYPKGELPGASVFLRDGDTVYHTYSTYARGLDMLINVYNFLDLTPYGRGEGWGGMPDLDGKGQGWLRHHDRYEGAAVKAACCEPGSCCA
ncbi:MAG: DUF899 domain-containing protein [Candidatus Hydrogenedentes bacterium]|nr:DUF899 domain-containing protein [Candidatus Hydrogenedentota bacterium]